MFRSPCLSNDKHPGNNEVRLRPSSGIGGSRSCCMRHYKALACFLVVSLVWVIEEDLKVASLFYFPRRLEFQTHQPQT